MTVLARWGGVSPNGKVPRPASPAKFLYSQLKHKKLAQCPDARSRAIYARLKRADYNFVQLEFYPINLGVANSEMVGFTEQLPLAR